MVDFETILMRHFTRATEYLSFIDLERGGFGEILPEVMVVDWSLVS